MASLSEAGYRLINRLVLDDAGLEHRLTAGLRDSSYSDALRHWNTTDHEHWREFFEDIAQRVTASPTSERGSIAEMVAALTRDERSELAAEALRLHSIG